MRLIKYRLRSKDQLFFLHIPKTGGTTFYSILSDYFPWSQVWPMHNDRINFFRQTSPEELDRYRLFRAHHDYCIYKFFLRKPVFITMLRNPIERVISHFQTVLRDKNHSLHHEACEKQYTVLDFIDHPQVIDRVNNRQVLQLAGAIQGDAKGLSEQSLIEIAKARLDEIAFFGLCEKYAESISLLCYIFDWTPPQNIKTLNVSPKSTRQSDYPKQIVERIGQRNLMDLEFYSYAVGLFEKRIEQMKCQCQNGSQ